MKTDISRESMDSPKHFREFQDPSPVLISVPQDVPPKTKSKVFCAIVSKLDISDLKTSSLDRPVKMSENRGCSETQIEGKPLKRRKKRRKRWLIAEIRKLKKCQSKYTLRKFLRGMSSITGRLLRHYVSYCFVMDVCSRRLENKTFLISKRSLFFRIIEEPELLSRDCHFDNNILKNFCTGASNFIQMHLGRIMECLVLYHEI